MKQHKFISKMKKAGKFQEQAKSDLGKIQDILYCITLYSVS